ncbi:MAG TPA: hypothetical protein VEM96_16615 [Pyrinomonadaceae bacterium]|nr:hypothetical protein [Pyrinomonadaceae bacterium]
MLHDLAQGLVALLPVLVGAALGLVGALVGRRYAHGLASKKDQTALRRGKMEELVAASYELKLWLTKEENYFLFRGPDVIELSPLVKTEMLVKLYFPSLSDTINELALAAAEYRSVLMNTKQDMDKTKAIAPNANQIEVVVKASKEVGNKHDGFLKEAQREMAVLLAS